MTAHDSLQGVGTALVTPFAGERVDFASLKALVRQQLKGGVSFLVPCGTTGESPTLTDAERVAVIECVVETANGSVPIVAGTGTNDTPHSIAMTKAAKRAGADACLAVAPYYNRPSQEGVYRHVRAMIDEGGLPAVLYHIPGRCGIGIDVGTMARVAKGGGVAGIKETERVSRVTDMRRAFADVGVDVPILSGDDGLTLPMIALGADGVISVASNVFPARVSALVAHARADEGTRARTVHEALHDVVHALFPGAQPNARQSTARHAKRDRQRQRAAAVGHRVRRHTTSPSSGDRRTLTRSFWRAVTAGPRHNRSPHQARSSH